MLVATAKAFAIGAHEAVGQKRRYTKNAYWFHCSEVAYLVEKAGASQEAIAAAWLHDVVEDTEVRIEIIRSLFGPKVADLVFWLTDSEEGNRATRKRLARNRLSQAPAEVHTIKLADLIDNAGSISVHDPKFYKVFVQEAKELLTALCLGDTKLYHIAKDYFDEDFLD